MKAVLGRTLSPWSIKNVDNCNSECATPSLSYKAQTHQNKGNVSMFVIVYSQPLWWLWPWWTKSCNWNTVTSPTSLWASPTGTPLSCSCSSISSQRSWCVQTSHPRAHEAVGKQTNRHLFKAGPSSSGCDQQAEAAERSACMQWSPAHMQTCMCVCTRTVSEKKVLMQEFAMRDAGEISNRKAPILILKFHCY